MSATPQDVQAKLDAAVAALELTTVGYKNKNWKTPPAGSEWAIGLADIAAARAEAGQLLPPPTPTPSPAPPANTVTQSLTAGQTLTGTVKWAATPSGAPSKVDFIIDGVARWTAFASPWQYGGASPGVLDTTTLTNGSHTFAAKATYRQDVLDTNGTFALSPVVTCTVSNAAAPPTPSPGAGPSGIPIPATPSGWTRVYTEDFNTPVALGAWPASAGGALTKPPGYTDLGAYPYPWKNSAGGGLYDPSRVLSIHDSMLDTYIHSASDGQLIGTVQALLPIGQTRMRVQFCTLFPVIANCHVSFLLWPDDNVWPKNGEVDFPEGDLNTSTGAFQCFVHLENATTPSSPGWQLNHNFSPALADGKWHIYTIEWVAGDHVTVQRDDTPAYTFTETMGQMPNMPMHFEHQTDANGANSGVKVGSGHILTDWLTVAV